MLKTGIVRTRQPTVAHSADRKITLAPLACPHSAHDVRAVRDPEDESFFALQMPIRPRLS